MDRSELVSYLAILKAYESIKYELELIETNIRKDMEQVAYDGHVIELNNNAEAEQIRNNVYALRHELSEAKRTKSEKRVDRIKAFIGIVLCIITFMSLKSCGSNLIHDNIKFSTAFFIFVFCCFLGLIGLYLSFAWLDNSYDKHRSISKIERELSEKKSSLSFAESRQQQRNQYNNNSMHDKSISLNAKIRENSKKLNYINNKLSTLYSFNEIPMQFRNLQGVVYLYDFLSTSKLSFSDAIKSYQLERVINSIEQLRRDLQTGFAAVMNSQLRQIQQQQQMLGAINRLNRNLDAFSANTTTTLNRINSHSNDASIHASLIEHNLQVQKDIVASIDWRDRMRFYHNA